MTATDASMNLPQPTMLDPVSGHVTLINTYVVEPERADELVEFLVRSRHSTIKHIPGFPAKTESLEPPRKGRNGVGYPAHQLAIGDGTCLPRRFFAAEPEAVGDGRRAGGLRGRNRRRPLAIRTSASENGLESSATRK
jgi:hypothetical protein